MSGLLPAEPTADCALLLLPGAQMTVDHMLNEGLLDMARERQVPLDVVPLSLHQEGPCDRSALQRLEVDVLALARERYKRVWLGGISMGGLLSLAYLASGVGKLDGMCLLAPYPGSRLTLNAIDRAGGLQAWVPSPQQLVDAEFRVWSWLQKAAPAIPMYLGYGEQDRFAAGIERMAHCLTRAHIEIVPGGHEWSAWRTLWSKFLDCGYFKA